MDLQPTLALLGEPTRFRIVTLLAGAPRTVGELATLLGALQPQTTKHLQALEAAGVITMHELGRRRVAALNRGVLRTLAEELGAFAVAEPSESVLEQYARAVELEQASGDRSNRSVSLSRILSASPARVWTAWTDPELLGRWWAPDHFELVRVDFAPVVGAPLLMVLREGDGTEYSSTGRMREVDPLRRLVFELAPLAPDGRRLFVTRHELELTGAAETKLTLDLQVSEIEGDAAPTLAGLELGWGQLLDHLAALLALP